MSQEQAAGADRSSHSGQRRDHTTSAGTPAAIFQPHRPCNLYPVGRLWKPPEEERGEVSRANRLKFSIDTWVTDLHRLPTWYVGIGIDDTASTRRQPLLLELIPISIHSQSTVDADTTTAATTTPATTTTLRMDLEPRTRMIVTLVPKSIRGSPPRWFREQIEFDHLSTQRRYR